MRQIKFRGKRLDNGEWRVGSLLNIEDTYFIIENDDFSFDYRDESAHFWFDAQEYEVDPNTIGQFTGLYDKNGKEIYEGDLLRYLPVRQDKWDEENFVANEVFFHGNDCCDMHIGWQMNRRHFQGHICGTSENPQMKPSTTAQMEVIGNIHDNPELIKRKDK